MIGVKPMCIRLDKVNGFVRVYDGTGYLVLFADGKYYLIYNRIRYLVGVKSGTTCYIRIELMFLKEFIVTRHAHQKSTIFVTTGIF